MAAPPKGLLRSRRLCEPLLESLLLGQSLHALVVLLAESLSPLIIKVYVQNVEVPRAPHSERRKAHLQTL